MPKSIHELFFDCYDAKVFADPKNQNILSKIFFRSPDFKRVTDRLVYFILGEKGTGKTITAQYFAKIDQGVESSIVDFSTIDFVQFENMIAKDFISITPLDKIWFILLSSVAVDHLLKSETGIFSGNLFDEFRPLVAKVPKGAIRPEFPAALQILNKFDGSVTSSKEFLVALQASASHENKSEFAEIQTPLIQLADEFERKFQSARVKKSNIIFVDGIDVKPESISSDRFITHLRAFVHSVLKLNENFTSMKGGGFCKFVILLRPDIFNRLNLQNQSAKVSDNSLVLSWNSSSDNFRSFNLYDMANNFLLQQNDRSEFGEDAWEYYVERDVFGGYYERNENKSFLEFTRYSWFRPRDIVRLLMMCKVAATPDEHVITRAVFERARQNFSDYLLGEARDYWRFYYHDQVFDQVSDFFYFLSEEKDFTWSSYLVAHGQFLARIIHRDGVVLGFRVGSPGVTGCGRC